MKTRIVQIGNSKAIRLPKLLLEESGLGEYVEIRVEGNHLIIEPAERPREGWDQAFAEMAREEDDVLLDSREFTPSRWDEEEWEWE
jgi:antitoxin MazE